MKEFFEKIFSSSEFMPHGYCYLWRPDIVWLHAVSDGLIALSYYVIPILLIYFVRKRRDLPFHWMFIMFGAFIFGCGTTHLMEVWTLWHGTYRLAGVVKAITAGASLATAAALFPMISKALAIPSPEALRREIDDRKLAEEALQNSEERLRLAMESGKSVGWDRDVKSGRDSLFGDLRSVFGIPSEVYDGRVEDFHRYLHPEDRALVVEAIDYAMQTHKPYAAEFRLLWPDGTVRWLAAKGKFYYSEDGEPERMLGVAIDSTERKLAEEALRESEERFRLAAQAGRMYAFEWNVVTDVIVRSGESSNILGSTGEPIRLTKRDLLAHIHPEDRARFIDSIVECTPERPNTEISYRLLRPDGSVVWLERTGHAFFDEQGRMLRMIGMVANITERKLAEEALSTVSQKLIEAHEEERTRIARELHDDINQRVALLAAHLDGLKRGLSASAAELGSQIGEIGKQLGDLGTDIQILSHRLHPPKLEYLGLAAAAASFCRELSDRHGVDIDFHSEKIPRDLLHGISLSLFRVLQEALQNATKHSGSRQFQVSLRGGANEIELTVHDSGIGFEPEEAIKGRGLGLTSMQERLRLVDGQLSIDSKLQHGTTIRAWVPLTP